MDSQPIIVSGGNRSGDQVTDHTDWKKDYHLNKTRLK